MPALVRSTHHFYDSTGRPVRVVHPDAAEYGTASESTTQYQPLVAIAHDVEDTDLDGRWASSPTRTRSDGLGRPVALEREAPTGATVTHFGYDALGRRHLLTDHEGHTQRLTRDLLGRIGQVDHPDAGGSSYQYDSVGNLLERVDARGMRVATTYDEANRVLESFDPARRAATSIQWAYDGGGACGAECTHTEGAPSVVSYPLLDNERGEERFAHDARGRVVLRRFSRYHVNYDFQSEYDNANRLVASRYPGSTRIAFEHDGLGRVIEVPGYIPAVSYSPEGNVQELVLPGNVMNRMERDTRLRLRRDSATGANDEVLHDLRFDLSRGDLLLHVRDMAPEESGPSHAVEFDYDHDRRVVAATLDPEGVLSESLSYGYDAIDRVLDIASSNGRGSVAHVGSLAYSDASHPRAATSVGGAVYTYDAAGNVATRVGQTLHWDHMNRLSRIQDDDGPVAEYAYGTALARVLSRVGDETTHYFGGSCEVRDGVVRVLLDVANETRVEVLITRGLAQRVADPNEDGVVNAGDAWLALQAGGDVGLGFRAAAWRLLIGDESEISHGWLHNHQGSVVAVTDSSGHVVERTTYYPTGIRRSNTTEDQSWGFTGQEHERRTGLTYHGARYLDSRIGRWLQPDPLMLGEWPEDRPREAVGTYSYVNNGSSLFVDATGTILDLSRLSDDERTQILGLLQQLSDDELGIVNGHVEVIAPNARGTAHPAGTQLIREVIDHERRTQVLDRTWDRRFRTGPATSAYPSGSRRGERPARRGVDAGRGINAQIGWNFDILPSQLRGWVRDGSAIVRADSPLHIVLAHELVHALRQMNGHARAGIDDIQPSNRSDFQDEAADPTTGRGMIWSAPEERETIDIENEIRIEQGENERVGHREQS